MACLELMKRDLSSASSADDITDFNIFAMLRTDPLSSGLGELLDM